MPGPPAVAITGIGVESCVGRDVGGFWDNLRNGVSGIRPLDLGEEVRFPSIGARVLDFDPAPWLPPSQGRRLSRCQQMLIAAASKAVDDAGGLRNPEATAIVLGTGGGGLEAATEESRQLGANPRRPMDRFILLKSLPNFGATPVAQRFGVTGPCYTVSTACASALDAVGLALGLLRGELVETVLVLSADTIFTRFGVGCFATLNVLSHTPAERAAEASRPFDRARDGIVLGEGAAAMVLDRVARGSPKGGSKQYALVRGYGASCDAVHPTAPASDSRPGAAAITAALASAAIDASTVDHVNAHGTATRLNDIAETRALYLALGERAASVPVTALKSLMGHALGASGLLELAAAALSIRDQTIPGTANYTDPDPECPLNVCRATMKAPLRTVLKTAFGFGGQNAAIILSAP